MNTILYCFYDLSISPASYDFLVFLQLAELHRIRYGFDQTFFIFVPGERDGFRDDSLSKTTAQRYMMMRNVVIPACRLLPSHVGTVWLSNGNETEDFFEKANGNIFPRLYSPEQPKTDYVWRGVNAAYLRGESLSLFTEPLEYTEMVQLYLKESNLGDPRKIVTVTIRETDYHLGRNTNCAEWSPFLKELSNEEYRIIVIPDTGRVWNTNFLLDDFEHCQTASIDILFRAALYRQAYVNIGVNNGPIHLGSLMGVPTIVFKYASEDTAATPIWLKNVQGIEFGDQFPICKINYRVAWGPERKEFLLDQFNKFVNDFPDLYFEPIPEHGIQSERQRQILCQVAWSYLCERLAVAGDGVIMIDNVLQEDIDTLEAIIKNSPDWAEPRYMLGQFAESTGHFDIALQLLNDCIQISQNSGEEKLNEELYKDVRLMRAGIFEKTGRMRDALEVYLELGRVYPEDNEISRKVASLQEYDLS